MKLKELLGEEMGYKKDGRYMFQTLKNPTKKEIEVFSKRDNKIKIILNSDDNTFLAVPDDVDFKDVDNSSTTNKLHLIGEIKDGIIKIKSFDTFFYNLLVSSKKFNQVIKDINKWSWADKYVDITNFLKSQV